MPLFGSTEIFSSIKQALLGTQATSLDSMIEKLFPSEVTARISQTNGSSGTPSYAPLGILAFEAAAAMNRGVELWEALQLPKLTKLRQNLECEAIQKLTSKNSEFVWRLAGVEKENDLKGVMSAVAQLGQKSLDPRLKKLNERFKALMVPNADISPGDLPEKTKESLICYMKDMVTTTQNLHAELEALQAMEPLKNGQTPRGKVARELAAINAGTFNSMYINPKTGKPFTMADKIQFQTKIVQRLKATCLWVENADRTVKLLVLMVYVLKHQFEKVFGNPSVSPSEISGTLGACGLALHYAHVLTAIAKMVERPTLVLRAQREDLYKKIPSNVRYLLKQRLRGPQKPFDLELASDLRRSLESMLQWMTPVVQATLMWQRDHSYGQQFNRKTQVFKVQTLFLASKEAVEVVLLELLVGLSYIVRPMGVANMSPSEAEKWKEWVASGGQREPKMGFVPRIRQRREETVESLAMEYIPEPEIDIVAPADIVDISPGY